jgi:23S rRNA (cytosine1962-C5)-methyltransferase
VAPPTVPARYKSAIVWCQVAARGMSDDARMSILGVPVTVAGEQRLAARPPQLPIADLQPTRDLEPGRPVRLLDARGKVLATGAADPENELVRLWAHGEEARAPDAAFMRGRLRTALALRQTLGLAEPESAYRLVNGEGDGLSGLAADIYGPFVVVNALSRGLLGHARLLAQCALEVLPAAGLALRGAVLKARLKGTGNTPERAKDDVVAEAPPDKLIVREHGVPYEVHLRGGINVGLFTDMREHRAGLARFVRGKRVLNTFAYTGALSVAAVRAGAARVTSVDLAAGPLAWARANFALSGLDAAAHRWEVSDVFRFLEAERERRAAHDVVILDPPTVSGARASLWAQKRDYPELIAAACAVLPEEGGHLWISSNTHSGPAVLKHVGAGLALARRDAQVLELGGLPPDYPTPLNWPPARYLEVCQVRVGPAWTG